jgi:excisionase family DNA binding protein
MPAMDNPNLLALSRMARRLGVTAGWLRDEAAAGRVPALRAGKRYLFSPEAVERVLATRAAGETGDAARGGPPR